ncbi:MAG: TIGR01777 family protein [Bryobacterales bacterium]|nr:TIGR01777 family protein [Bryobacterales bacterium]
MKIVIPGGSGQIGTILAHALHGAGHDVIVLSRGARSCPWRVVRWDGSTPGPWADEIDGCDVVINLAGRSVNCRYTAANRKEILESRIASTRAVGMAIAGARRPPRVWLQASTATIYAHRYDGPNDEAAGIPGGNEPDVPPEWAFSVEVARTWERTFFESPAPRTRRVALRSAMTMSPGQGGVFDTLLGLVRRGLGGTAGDGRQYVSWIHYEDFLRAVHWLIVREAIDGVVNVSSPQPLTNKEFMKHLRNAWGSPIGLPASKWMLEAGAILLRTETELILKSRRVVPGRLLEHGFEFAFPAWEEAAADLCRRYRTPLAS